MKDKDNKPTSATPGLAILGLFATGFGGLVLAFTMGSGTALVASALAFGVVAYVSFK